MEQHWRMAPMRALHFPDRKVSHFLRLWTHYLSPTLRTMPCARWLAQDSPPDPFKSYLWDTLQGRSMLGPKGQTVARCPLQTASRLEACTFKIYPYYSLAAPCISGQPSKSFPQAPTFSPLLGLLGFHVAETSHSTRLRPILSILWIITCCGLCRLTWAPKRWRQ